MMKSIFTLSDTQDGNIISSSRAQISSANTMSCSAKWSRFEGGAFSIFTSVAYSDMAQPRGEYVRKGQNLALGYVQFVLLTLGSAKFLRSWIDVSAFARGLLGQRGTRFGPRMWWVKPKLLTSPSYPGTW